MEILSPVFARITKVDEATRTVTGRATQECVDRDNEVFDYATSKPNFMKWSAEVHAETGGKSLGNVRSMHGNTSAGILTDINFDDHEKAIDVSAHIVDDQEWKKVLTGCYSGFSIGGKYTKKWPDIMGGKMVNRYTAMPAEISIVDRPCVPTAKFFTVHKADGSRSQVPFAASLMLPMEGSVMDDAPAGLGLLVKVPASTLLKGGDQERDPGGRFAGGTASDHADSAMDHAQNARELAHHDYNGVASKQDSVKLTDRAQRATIRAAKTGDAEDHHKAQVAHMQAMRSWHQQGDSEMAGLHEKAVSDHGSAQIAMHAGKSDSGDLAKDARSGGTGTSVSAKEGVQNAVDANGEGQGSPADLIKVVNGKDAPAMQATGAAIAATQNAITSADSQAHETAAQMHAAAAQAHYNAGNTELAQTHVSAAHAHLRNGDANAANAQDATGATIQ